MKPPIALVAVDWGTTNRRAWALGRDGAVLEARADGAGLLSVPDRRFAESFQAFAGNWLAEHRPPVLMCGMVGSRMGWSEAPYVRTPATPDDLARNLHRVPFAGGEISIVPGVATEGEGAPDVMRGEECQIFGLLRTRGIRDAAIVLPGTHSKWVAVRDGALAGFRTYLTGELFALLKANGTLAQVLQDGPHDNAAFKRGLERSADGSLLHDLFGVRALGLFARMSGSALGSYLSGLLIGSEFADAKSLLRGKDKVIAIGSPALLAHYAAAAQHFGLTLEIVDSAALLPRALFAIARAAGMLA